jgi:hypothetical protein
VTARARSSRAARRLRPSPSSEKGLSELILEQKYGRQLSWDRATTIALAHPRERERERERERRERERESKR